MKSEQWLKDREALRTLAREGNLRGNEATLVYTLISHMRGKIHMRYYGKYRAGWRPYPQKGVPKDKQVAALSREFHKAYGDYAKTYHYMIAIDDLNDQAEWLFAHEEYSTRAGVNSIFGRILIEGYPEVEDVKDSPVAQLVEQPAS